MHSIKNPHEWIIQKNTSNLILEAIQMIAEMMGFSILDLFLLNER